MQALIEHLAKLQNVELERARLTQVSRALPAEAAEAETALTQAQRRATEASDALRREETLRRRQERDVEELRQKAARYRTQQNSVTTPAQAAAIEHEVGFAEAEITQLEDEELASLERTEAQEAALAQARTQVEELAVALDKTRDRIRARQEECARERAILDKERESLRALIEPDWLARFDRIAASRGTGIARAESQQCTGCRMGVRPQVWNQLREGQLLTCDSCSRLLYWDPAMVPPPKSPQMERATSDGHAIRKPHQAGA
ncbi:MAG TPA: C4-type zinc ribbon domain-containing protein [Terracidiphilus sp.]|nr:C4-type zinc ribbon domain-containing protein [Terracidiphilus sp.]